MYWKYTYKKSDLYLENWLFYSVYSTV